MSTIERYSDIDTAAAKVVEILRKNAVLDEGQQTQTLLCMIRSGIIPIEFKQALLCYMDLAHYDRNDISAIGRAAYMLHTAPLPQVVAIPVKRKTKTAGRTS